MNKTLHYAASLSKDTHTPHLLDVCEFGVAEGRTIRQLRAAYPTESVPTIFGFDSFEGLPEDWVGARCLGGYGEEMKKGRFSTNGVVPQIDNVTFYKGLFSETLPEYVKTANPIKLCHIDCDLYSSTKDVLYTLNHLIVPGTILCFDEWYYNQADIEENRQHEQKCFYEWVEANNRRYILFNEIEKYRKIALITK
jgi:hypothetical protein